MKLNQRSDHLVILVGSYNRRDRLMETIESIRKGTRCPYEIIVIDAGSTDGAVEYLKSQSDLTCLFQGKRIGQPRAFNAAWRDVDCRYTCWLSDDTVITDGALDLAVEILEQRRDVGMVGLKMKDVAGEFIDQPYMGSVSEHGVLNCNHGVLSMSLLEAVGYFNEAYRAYMLDPDLTASVLCTGKKVVMTRDVCVLHHRDYEDGLDMTGNMQLHMGGVDSMAIYREKFRYLEATKTPAFKVRRRIFKLLAKALKRTRGTQGTWLGLTERDANNLANGRTIRPWDPIASAGNSYHLVQSLPQHVLSSAGNPYRDLVGRVD